MKGTLNMFFFLFCFFFHPDQLKINPVLFARRVEPLALVFSLSSHDNHILVLYTALVLSICNKQTKGRGLQGDNTDRKRETRPTPKNIHSRLYDKVGEVQRRVIFCIGYGLIFSTFQTQCVVKSFQFHVPMDSQEMGVEVRQEGLFR